CETIAKRVWSRQVEEIMKRSMMHELSRFQPQFRDLDGDAGDIMQVDHRLVSIRGQFHET
ncbi:MAG: hypothetical protein WCI17_06655, partial [bacterium]